MFGPQADSKGQVCSLAHELAATWCWLDFQEDPSLSYSSGPTFLNLQWSGCPANQNVNLRTTQFAVSGQTSWNSLPQYFHDATPIIGQFQRRLKMSLVPLSLRAWFYCTLVTVYHHHHHHKHFQRGLNNVNYCKDHRCPDSSDEWW